MKKVLFLLVLAVILAGAALAVRQSGIDFAALVRQAMPGVASSGKQLPAQGKPLARGPAPVETATAAASQLRDDISAIGTLLAEESVAVAPETSGRVAEILFSDGARVEAGTGLFKLDSDLASAALSEAKARLELAQSTFARNQTLRKTGAVAQSTFEAADTERIVAMAAVETAQVQLRKLTITAPFSGTLGFRTVSEGAFVTAGMPLVQLDKTDHLKASFAVPELQQSHVAVGQDVEFTADALPGESFSARIVALDPSLDVNGRSLQVRAELDNSAGKLRPGLLVRVSVKGQPRTAVVVPEAAIVLKGEDPYVYVVSSNRVREVKVALGKRLPGRVEITQGVSAGDIVVTAGHTRLGNGAEVEIVQSAASAE